MSTETNAKTRRLVQLAVTTALATTALSACTGKVAPSHNYSAAQAETALAKGKTSKAITHAEAAVLASPRDAYTRTLLANAYLEAGRFQSAATTFAEAIELGDNAPRTIISYTLALTAIGDQAGALETLRVHQSEIDPADFGLALALAGEPGQGVHILLNTLRGGQNTVKVRQNLAYAYALSGSWTEARLIAANDVPGDELNKRMASWASMASPEFYTARVASLLGVEAKEDPGQPAMLALSNHQSVEQLAQESADTVDTAPQSDFALASELPAVDQQASVDDSADAALAEAGISNDFDHSFAQAETVQPLPATYTPAAKKTDVSLVAAPPKAQEPAPFASHALASGDYNIQLGSYFSMSDAQAAWKVFQKRYPELSGAEKVITKARVNGKIYYRVAAAGYAKASAQSMCRTVKSKGEGCIAYAATNPLPGALAVVRDEVRVAAR
ncbi:SPOR domain-containing protein [Qipengyuania soli]|uniref:SPOR domain-containing protein n=1 Tax=Qipengyuania soli TaxID=2782568 RepID=A0A7S8F5B3_9SPHN|nr:tetratricopeptide repeat protein [Qipengyuania soli]QPC99268.1 SPOR domain-containing protein [Qipengyuania soli]